MQPPNIFVSPPDVNALVTLVLIENSEAMRPSWGVLRQHYLPTLLGTMRKANPVVPIPVLWLVTAPVGDDATDLHSAPPRQYNQLPELKFNSSPDNKISSRIINKAIELMLEAASQFQGGPVNFHLFIVAASSPAEGAWGVSLTMPTQIGQSEWRLLGQRMAQLQIHCHMILFSSLNMSSMNELFLSSLELHGHTQVRPWFSSSPEYTFLLSGNPLPHDIHSIDQPGQQPFYAVARPPVLRHQSFPQDAQSTAASPAPPSNDATPSLVSSLQKVHGLSRKKLYGAQPPRQPFVREEPVRAKYKSTPTPLSIPVGSQPFPVSEDGRAVGRTKVERGRRVDRPPQPGDLNSTSPGRRCSWNRVASDVGSSPSSPNTSLSSHNTASPTIPLYPDLPVYTSPPTASAGFSPTMISPEAGFSASLHDPSAGYFPVSPSPSFQSPMPSGMPVPSQGTSWASISGPVSNSAMAAQSTETLSAAKRHSQELPHGSYVQSLSAMSSKYRLESVSNEPRSIPKNTQKVKDAGDVPFIFSPELEAATAAKLKAVLQSTSPALSSNVNAFPPPGSSHGLNYSAAENGYPALHGGRDPQALSSAAPRPLGYTMTMDACPVMALADKHIHSGNGTPHVRFGGGMSSSSLQGWAG